MRKAALTAFMFAAAHALLCFWLIRWTSGPFQSWFDTGAPMSKAEGLGHLAALTLSFPGALWALTQHPAGVSTEALAMSVAANSSSWAGCLFLLLAWLRRRAASNKGRRPTADTQALM
jgi:hypothetical protein